MTMESQSKPTFSPVAWRIPITTQSNTASTTLTKDIASSRSHVDTGALATGAPSVVFENIVTRIVLSEQINYPPMARAFGTLSVRERFQFILKTDPFEFIVLVTGLCGSVAALAAAVWVVLLSRVTMAAFAAQPATAPVPANSSLDATNILVWIIVGTMAIGFIGSFVIVFRAQRESQIKFGTETVRTIGGFLAGFVGGHVIR